MSIWTTFTGEIILSGQKYDGKGFGLRSVWYNTGPITGGIRRFCFNILKDGKLTKHYSRDIFYEALNNINVPHGSEGGSVIDILESKIDGDIHICFSRNLRGEIDNKRIRDWIICFIKERQKEGWKVNCNITYGMDTLEKDNVYISFKNQESALEKRIIHNKFGWVEQSWIHNLKKDVEPKLVGEYNYSDKSISSMIVV